MTSVPGSRFGKQHSISDKSSGSAARAPDHKVTFDSQVSVLSPKERVRPFHCGPWRHRWLNRWSGFEWEEMEGSEDLAELHPVPEQHAKLGGQCRTRTCDLLLVRQAL